MTQELARYTEPELERIAELFAASGYFQDAREVAQAFTKIMVGQDIGIGPTQSMMGVFLVKGKPGYSATLIGSMVKRSGRYDYRVKQLDDKACTLVFYERGEPVGESTFTLQDAQKAGLDKQNPTYRTYPRNMLLNRALTNGARWYCPDVFGGAVYTPDELGGQVEFDADGEVVAPPEASDLADPGEAGAGVPVEAPPSIFASDEQISQLHAVAAEAVDAGAIMTEHLKTSLKRDYDANDFIELSPEQAEHMLTRLRAVLPPDAPADADTPEL